MHPLALTKSILVVKLDTLQVPHNLLPIIRAAVECTTERVLILVFCDLFNDDRHLSHTKSWNDVQRLLTLAYVEAAGVAQEKDRVLMEVDVLLRGCDTEVLNIETEWDHIFLADGGDFFSASCISLPLLTIYAY